MAKFLRALFLTAAVLVSPVQAGAAEGPATGTDAYLIQPGDLIEISIWREEDLTRSVLVLPDGSLSFPLAGNIQAAGKSVEQVQAIATERMEKFIPDPVITVSLQQLSGNKVYVIGKVLRPGEFVANRNMDVVQALSVAGGMTPYAAANKIKVLRRENGRLTAIPFRYGDIEKGEALEQNIILKSGDVVLVP